MCPKPGNSPASGADHRSRGTPGKHRAVGLGDLSAPLEKPLSSILLESSVKYLGKKPTKFCVCGGRSIANSKTKTLRGLLTPGKAKHYTV